jgi:hypothetical protein
MAEPSATHAASSARRTARLAAAAYALLGVVTVASVWRRPKGSRGAPAEPSPVRRSSGGSMEALRAQMERESKKWTTSTTVYGFTYYASRIALMIASAIVAAKETLAKGVAAGVVAWVPTLAVFVAVLTAFDTWLKPQQKWKGFMESRDRLGHLIVRSESDDADVAQLRDDFDALRTQHRDLNVF